MMMIMLMVLSVGNVLILLNSAGVNVVDCAGVEGAGIEM